MSAAPLNETDYVSEEDSDFAPDDAPAEASSASDDDEPTETEKPAQGKRSREGANDTVEDDAGFENSGDEAIIEKGKKRQKKSKRKDEKEGEDEGGEGGLIKTRRMRAAEKAEKRAEVASGPVTIDVDALWAQMTLESGGGRNPQESTSTQPKVELPKPSSQPKPKPVLEKPEQSDLIRIKRTYNFAGKVHTEEKLVPRDSAEAKLYLAENGGSDSTPPDGDSSPTRKRMPRKAFRSRFEPVAAESSSYRSDLNLGMSDRLRARELAKETDAKKLNTVEKSRMDWAGFVDREGIKDELELAGKSKHSFAARQDFLARSEALREDEARRLRMTNKT
ncbi:bucentaur or craniofacial development-domain-containing protein [Chaetomium fimeti]|uniref:SWR1-complex protein 5 n=1 Tax=Chaetomium fimeti TaxID=1854472 RepID=A0AAE0HGY9_9PEZI|nr:bucentaur or craniofacial development-domain-containing protein [Chaetomium fimeti]